MKKIITISREFGSGGGTIGKKVAERLGFEYYDKDLIFKTAAKANMSPDEAMELDENLSHGFGFGQSLFNLYSSPLDEKLYETQKKVIREFAEKGNCVIVGRNANAILAEFDATLHVFISANPNWRVKYLKADKMKDMPEDKIMAHLQKIDKARQKYCSYFTNTEFGVAKYYDVCLYSSVVGIDKCVDVICSLAK